MTEHSLPASLQRVVSSLGATRDLSAAALRRIVVEAGVSATDLEPWRDLGYPAEDSYGRKLVYRGANFELLVMSWRPGAFSAIHDHGQAQWGAVQVFGPAEHACFRIDDQERLETASRKQLEPGTVLAVTHWLVHQMGNPTDRPFLSLHVYGTPGDVDIVTANARVFDVERAQVQRTSGGVFFALSEGDIDHVEPGPRGSFATLLRYRVEAIKRLRRMHEAGVRREDDLLEELTAAFWSVEQRRFLWAELRELTDDAGHFTDSVQWGVLNQELKAAAALQGVLRAAEGSREDRFSNYAEEYDALIGQPNLDAFMRGYLARFAGELPLGELDILSVGCGTGLVEQHLIEVHGADRERLLGVDLSEAMVRVAQRRIRAEALDLFELGSLEETYDLAYSGLNVLQYTSPARFEQAVDAVAQVVRPGGRFLGDFITSDHIRWYPNLVHSESGDVLSLRTPRLIERGGSMLQESEITNVSFADGRMAVEHVGRHARVLPPMLRVRRAFERAFGGRVELFDAISLEPLPDIADTCPSTRYVVWAEKR